MIPRPAGPAPLLPRLGATPRGPWPLAPLLVAVAALGTLWLHPEQMPGRGDFPDGEGTMQLYWSLFRDGLAGYFDDRLLMYPLGADRLLQNGLAVDAVLLWPWVRLLGPGLGWTVGHALLLALTGLAGGWLAGRWWRSGAAAAVGGVTLQLAGITLRELAYGRPTQIVFLALFPVCTGLLLDAILDGAPRRALVAGALLGLATLAWWYAALVAAPVLAGVLIAGWVERQRVFGAALHLGAGLGATAAPFLLLALGHVSELGGVATSYDGLVVHGDMHMRLGDLLAQRGSLFAAVEEGAITARPLTFALAAIGVLAPERTRRRLLPALLLLLACVLALGPAVVVGPVRFALPFGAFLDIPLVRRFWWPDRFLLVAALAVSLFAARAVLRWRPAAVVVLLGALVAEAAVANPWMPLPASSAEPSGAARWLAQGTGPALVLPARGGTLSLSAGVLRDQPYHGRPLLNGMVPADATVAPPAWQDFASTGILGDLLACEHGATPPSNVDAGANLAALRALGATDAVLDRERYDATSEAGVAYQACVERLLGPGVQVDGAVAWALRGG